MFAVSKPSANRVDITIRGALDSDAMRQGLADLIEMSEGMTRGRMLYRISDFALPTMGALGVEFSYLPKLFGLLGKFDKCAVIADEAWIRTTAQVEGALFPGVEIKSFSPDQEDAAEAWLEPATQAA